MEVVLSVREVKSLGIFSMEMNHGPLMLRSPFVSLATERTAVNWNSFACCRLITYTSFSGTSCWRSSLVQPTTSQAIWWRTTQRIKSQNTWPPSYAGNFSASCRYGLALHVPFFPVARRAHLLQQLLVSVSQICVVSWRCLHRIWVMLFQCDRGNRTLWYGSVRFGCRSTLQKREEGKSGRIQHDEGPILFSFLYESDLIYRHGCRLYRRTLVSLITLMLQTVIASCENHFQPFIERHIHQVSFHYFCNMLCTESEKAHYVNMNSSCFLVSTIAVSPARNKECSRTKLFDRSRQVCCWRVSWPTGSGCPKLFLSLAALRHEC